MSDLITREQFLAERQTGIGGSDAAAIVGVDEFRTAYEVALLKLGRVEPEDIGMRDPVIFGTELEDAVARIYSRKNGVPVSSEAPPMYRSVEHPYMLAHLDRRISLTKALEVKTSGDLHGWGPGGGSDVPPRVLVQCAHYYAVIPELEEIDVALVLAARGFQYRQYLIRRDEAMIADLIEAERFFWDGLQAGLLPNPDFAHPTTSKVLARVYPETSGEIIYKPTLETYTKVIQDAASKRLLYEKIEENCKAHIEFEMEGASVAIIEGVGKWVRSQVKRKAYSVEESKYMQLKFSKEKA